MIKHYNVEGRQLVEAQDDSGLIRVFVQPTPEEKRYLIDTLKLDEHTMQSALDPDELPRVEFEPEHVAVIYKRPRSYSNEDQLNFKVCSAGVFLFKDKLVIVTAEAFPFFENAPFFRANTPISVMLRLVFQSIVHFRDHLKVISRLSDELQQHLQTAMENRYLLNMFTLEKSLVFYLNAIHANGILLDRLKLNATKIGLSTEEVELLDDTSIENKQCYRQAEIYSNILASLMDARASIVSNNLNMLMKTLNIITVSIMVPTFVVSAFSMNVGIPLQKHPMAFWMILGMALVSVLGFFLFWRRKRW